MDSNAQVAADAAATQQQPQQQQQQQHDGEVELGDEDLDRMMGERVSFEHDVEQFLHHLYDDVYVRCVESIRRLYEVDYPTLSEKYFALGPWPSVEDVSAFYRQYQQYHGLIITLYTELYYRHLFLKCPDLVTWEHRKISWENYSVLVEFLADTTASDAHEKIQLPSSWLWDILDEFVYQFQDASRYRQRRCKALAEAAPAQRPQMLQEMEADSDFWPSSRVFELLQNVVQQSGIKQLLLQQRQDPAAFKTVDNELRYQLGYFALLLQLKLHVQVGAFYAAVKAVEDIELSSKALYWKVPAAHTSLMFYLGFAYMMLRRYQDAIRVMSQLLLAVARQRGQLPAASYQQAVISRSADRVHILLLLCSNLSNAKLDDSITQAIKERYSDKYYKLQQDRDEAYCELFTWAAPRFIEPASPPLDDPDVLERFASSHGEIQLRVIKHFLKGVQARRKFNTINSFAKLYNNIPLSKLATLMELEGAAPEEQVRADLMAAKLKGQQKIWRQGPLIAGEVQAAAAEGSVDFKVDGDMVHVKNQQTQRVYVDYFLKQIERTDALMTTLQQTAVPASSSPQTGSQDFSREARDGRRGHVQAAY